MNKSNKRPISTFYTEELEQNKKFCQHTIVPLFFNDEQSTRVLMEQSILPSEIWCYIYSFITNLKDICNLKLVCKLSQRCIETVFDHSPYINRIFRHCFIYGLSNQLNRLIEINEKIIHSLDIDHIFYKYIPLCFNNVISKRTIFPNCTITNVLNMLKPLFTIENETTNIRREIKIEHLLKTLYMCTEEFATFLLSNGFVPDGVLNERLFKIFYDCEGLNDSTTKRSHISEGNLLKYIKSISPTSQDTIRFMEHLCRKGEFELVKCLIERWSVNPSICNQGPIYWACLGGNRLLIEYLLNDPRVELDAGSDRDCLTAVVSNGSDNCLDIVRLLLIQPKKRKLFFSGQRAIIKAFEMRNIELIELLLTDNRINPAHHRQKTLLVSVKNDDSPQFVSILLHHKKSNPGSISDSLFFNALSNKLIPLFMMETLIMCERVDKTPLNTSVKIRDEIALIFLQPQLLSYYNKRTGKDFIDLLLQDGGFDLNRNNCHFVKLLISHPNIGDQVATIIINKIFKSPFFIPQNSTVREDIIMTCIKSENHILIHYILNSDFSLYPLFEVEIVNELVRSNLIELFLSYSPEEHKSSLSLINRESIIEAGRRSNINTLKILFDLGLVNSDASEQILVDASLKCDWKLIQLLLDKCKTFNCLVDDNLALKQAIKIPNLTTVRNLISHPKFTQVCTREKCFFSTVAFIRKDLLSILLPLCNCGYLKKITV